MNLLVTGGAGFIGSHFVLGHVAKHPGDTVVALDKMTYAADRSYLESVENAITFVEGDIINVELVAKLILEHDIDTIVNFAAESHVDNSIGNPFPFLHANVVGVQALIEVCRSKKNLKLLHISTDEVYGDVGDADPLCTVDSPVRPSSPYAATKAAGEMLVMAGARTYGIPACITRCTNNFGPHQAAEKFMPTIIRRALADQPIPVYGKGKNKRDWLYVTDHCDALEKVLATPSLFESGIAHVINISAEDERENIEVAKMILKKLGKPESLITFVTDRPGHDWRYAVDSEPLRKLGWKARVPFEVGLDRTIAWFRERSQAFDA